MKSREFFKPTMYGVDKDIRYKIDVLVVEPTNSKEWSS